MRAVEGTGTQIVDTRETTPGMRLLERYAVVLGGGGNNRFGLDDGVVITSNHLAIAGGLATAVKNAKEKVGYLHKITVPVANEAELGDALSSGADILLFESMPPEEGARLVGLARKSSTRLTIECCGDITLDNVRAYAEAGANIISIRALTDSARALDVTFQVQPA